MVQANPTRVDYLAKFEELIEAYNNGSRNIDDLFRELLALTQALTDEQQRHVREQLSEEELTVFDLLTRPGPDLTPEEREEVKKVARHILERVRAGAGSELAPEGAGPRAREAGDRGHAGRGPAAAYTPELYTAKCSRLFEHVYDSTSGLERALDRMSIEAFAANLRKHAVGPGATWHKADFHVQCPVPLTTNTRPQTPSNYSAKHCGMRNSRLRWC